MYSSLAMVCTIIYAAQSSVFVHQPDGTQTTVDITAETTGGDIKAALTNKLPHPEGYNLMYQGGPLDDNVLLSEQGIGAEVAIHVQLHDPNTETLKSHGFTEDQCQLFISTLERYSGNVYAVFWAEMRGPDFDTYPDPQEAFYFIKRDSRNKYSYYVMLKCSDNWEDDIIIANLYEFIKDSQRITEGVGPIVGPEYQFEARDATRDVGVSVGECRGLCKWFYRGIPAVVARCLKARNVDVPRWVGANCLLCHQRVQMHSQVARQVQNNMDAELAKQKYQMLLWGLAQYPAARIIANSERPRWLKGAASVGNFWFACIHRCMPKMEFNKKLAASACVAAGAGAALQHYLVSPQHSHFASNTMCRQCVPLNVTVLPQASDESADER